MKFYPFWPVLEFRPFGPLGNFLPFWVILTDLGAFWNFIHFGHFDRFGPFSNFDHSSLFGPLWSVHKIFSQNSLIFGISQANWGFLEITILRLNIKVTLLILLYCVISHKRNALICQSILTNYITIFDRWHPRWPDITSCDLCHRTS